MDDSPGVWIFDLMEHKFLNFKYKLIVLCLTKIMLTYTTLRKSWISTFLLWLFSLLFSHHLKNFSCKPMQFLLAEFMPTFSQFQKMGCTVWRKTFLSIWNWATEFILTATQVRIQFDQVSLSRLTCFSRLGINPVEAGIPLIFCIYCHLQIKH